MGRAVARPAAAKASDEEWLAELKNNPVYQAINVRHEYGKMKEWCKVNGKQPTGRRFINWLNRTDTPMNKTMPPIQSDGVDTESEAYKTWRLMCETETEYKIDREGKVEFKKPH